MPTVLSAITSNRPSGTRPSSRRPSFLTVISWITSKSLSRKVCPGPCRNRSAPRGVW
ncbi:Uncharacterised protein [Mycobacteroides abscessus subsp. abscessus]|nr:Uncharacterised protein [Mycobacteroides abscessus subsp. abscessus]